MSGAESSADEAALAGATEQRCPKELPVDSDWRATEGDQVSGCSAGGSQKKRKAVLRRESADTQEYESCQRNDVDVDMCENKDELSFIPSAVVSSAGWCEHQFTRDRQSRKKGFLYFGIASVMVEDDGEPYTTNPSQSHYDVEEAKEGTGDEQKAMEDSDR